MATSVLVIGATGMLGRPVTRRLVAEGFDVAALVRDVTRARAALPEGCSLLPGDLRDAASLDRALAGVDAVYLSLSNRMTAKRPAWDADADGTRAVIDAARRRGVDRVLRLSAMGVDEAASDWWVARVKVEVDDMLARSGLAYTIFRPTWLMESIAISAMGPLLLTLPGPREPLHWLAADDYARQVVAALRRPEAVNETYLCQGPEGIPMREAFRRFRQVWRGRLFPVPLPRAALALGANVVGPMHYLRALLRMTDAMAGSVPAEVNGHALYRPMVTIEAYARGLLEGGEYPVKRV